MRISGLIGKAGSSYGRARPSSTTAPRTPSDSTTVPRGADAVVMVEHTETRDEGDTIMLEVRRAAAAGQFIAFAGSDLARGETVLQRDEPPPALRTYPFLRTF